MKTKIKKTPKNPLGPEKDYTKTVNNFTINYKGQIQMNKIQDTIKEWFEENNFEYNEDLYESEKDQREINISAKIIKHNIKSEVKVYLKFYGNFRTAISQDKKYPEIDEGRLEIKIHSGKAELIKEDIYGDNRWLRNTLHMTKKIIWKTYTKLLDQEIDNEKRALRKKILELHILLKKTIKMTTQ